MSTIARQFCVSLIVTAAVACSSFGVGDPRDDPDTGVSPVRDAGGEPDAGGGDGDTPVVDGGGDMDTGVVSPPPDGGGQNGSACRREGTSACQPCLGGFGCCVTTGAECDLQGSCQGLWLGCLSSNGCGSSYCCLTGIANPNTVSCPRTFSFVMGAGAKGACSPSPCAAGRQLCEFDAQCPSGKCGRVESESVGGLHLGLCEP